ncbi:ATP-binding protein [Saccharothrix saharensis]|uniref:ATP-binding protein n=1 Tax=Saccharothrix saharensis TaxID=571190 RepID=UPI0036752C79
MRSDVYGGGVERVVMLYEGQTDARPVTLELTDEVPPLAGVRRWTSGLLSDRSADEVEDCLLVVTELVANAYDHGAAPRRLRVRRLSGPCAVRIEVDDAGDGEVVVGRSRMSAERGRGMVLVEHCSANWGVDRHEHGKTVWAEIACSDRPA